MKRVTTIERFIGSLNKPLQMFPLTLSKINPNIASVVLYIDMSFLDPKIMQQQINQTSVFIKTLILNDTLISQDNYAKNEYMWKIL